MEYIVLYKEKKTNAYSEKTSPKFAFVFFQKFRFLSCEKVRFSAMTKALDNAQTPAIGKARDRKIEERGGKNVLPSELCAEPRISWSRRWKRTTYTCLSIPRNNPCPCLQTYIQGKE